MSKYIIVKITGDRIKIKGGEYVRDLALCGGCRHWKPEDYEEGCGWCRHFKRETGADDFCSHGRADRKE